jgi:hypothetical protein
MDKAEVLFEKLAAYGADLEDYWDYGKDLVKHKIDVYQAGRQLSVPRVKLLVHDLDKFLPKMFMRYAEWFYGPQGQKGSKNPKLKNEWGIKIREHYARSPHHAHKVGKPKDVATELESLADWYSAKKRSSANVPGFPTFRTWLDNNIDRYNISEEAKSIAKS